MSEINPYATPESKVEESRGAEQHELAGRGQRLAAAIVDGMIGFAVSYPIFSALGIWSQVRPDGSMPLDAVLSVMVIGIGMFLVLHGYLLKKYGQTIGKKLLGIRIVDLENRLLPLPRLFTLRYLPVMLLSMIPLPGVQMLGLVDALFIFRGDRRCVHDLIAGTRVIRAR